VAILPPSYREKRRYILIYYKGSGDFLYSSIKQEYIRLFGLFGYSKAGILIKNLSENIYIIRINKKYVSNLLVTLYFLKINKNIIGIYRTIKQAKESLKDKYNMLPNNK